MFFHRPFSIGFLKTSHLVSKVAGELRSRTETTTTAFNRNGLLYTPPSPRPFPVGFDGIVHGQCLPLCSEFSHSIRFPGRSNNGHLRIEPQEKILFYFLRLVGGFSALGLAFSSFLGAGTRLNLRRMFSNDSSGKLIGSGSRGGIMSQFLVSQAARTDFKPCGKSFGIRQFPRIILEFILFAIAVQVLASHANLDGPEAHFKVTPEALNRVCVDDSIPHVFLLRMVNNVPLVSHMVKSVVSTEIVRHDTSINLGNIPLNDGKQSFCFTVRNNLNPDFAPALHHSENWSFIFSPAPTFATFSSSAGIMLIHFNNTFKRAHEVLMFHGMADAVQHEPCSLLSHTYHFPKSNAGNSFLAGMHGKDCEEPFMKRQAGIRKDSAMPDAELLPGNSALVSAGAAGNPVSPFISERRYYNTICPPALFQKFNARLLIGKLLVESVGVQTHA